MKLRLFNNMTKQGMKGMWRNRGMGLASISSISAVLMILGIVIIMILSINSLVIETKTKFDEIEIYLSDDVTEEELNLIEDRIEKTGGVTSITYRSREEALKIMTEDWGEEGYLLEGLEEDNTLPDSYIIQVANIQYADEVVKSVESIKGVDRINYHKEIIDKLMIFANYIRIGGMAIISLLIFVSIFIISNTIKLTVTARKREINIMKYVGASNGYIKGPFIIEGVMFGLIGALISIGLTYFGYEYFFNAVNEKVYTFFTMGLVTPPSIFKDITIIFIAIGTGIGAIGSLVSMKRFLNV